MNRLNQATRDRVVELALTTYAGVNRANLADLLAEREGIAVPVRSCGASSATRASVAARTGRPRGHRSRPASG